MKDDAQKTEAAFWALIFTLVDTFEMESWTVFSMHSPKDQYGTVDIFVVTGTSYGNLPLHNKKKIFLWCSAVLPTLLIFH